MKADEEVTISSNVIPSDDESISQAIAAQQRILVPLSNAKLSLQYRNAASTLSPTPVVLSDAFFRQLANIHDAIDAAVHALVSQWPTSPELQALIVVPDRIARLLTSRSSSPPYLPGTVRPDFLIEDNGNVRVCEINARFPLNGYLLSGLYAEGMHCEAMKPSSIFARLNLAPMSPLLSMIPDIRKRLVVDNADPTVFLIRKREPMLDTSILESITGITLRHARPEDLAVDGGPGSGLFYRENDNSLTRIKSAVLELHQDEFLTMSDEVLEAVAALSHAGKTLNDLRTIFLVHDKTFLSIIHSCILDLDVDVQKTLSQNVIPTVPLSKYALDSSPFAPGTTRVVKPALSGKGDGIVMEKNMTTEEFEAYLAGLPSDEPFILQPYIKQREFGILDIGGNVKTMKAVGIISSTDGVFYGPGAFRVGATDLISMAGGGSFAMPATRLISLPFVSRSFCETLETAKVSEIKKSLLNHGIALVGVNSDLEDKNSLYRFLTLGLGAECRTHSDTEGAVWDVRPARNWGKTHARSHTSLPFEMHTDASFEIVPPRFVAMSVVRSDRKGGGFLTVVRIKDAVESLTADAVHTLKNVKPLWVVPPEFSKAGGEDVIAPVLMSDTRARFRRDKLCFKHMAPGKASLFHAAFESFCEEMERRREGNTMLVPERSIIILDNHRFAHARSQVFDDNRHLHRVRFDFPEMS